MRAAVLALSLAVVACAEDRARPAGSSGVHDPGIADRASPGWHGAILRAAGWAPMIDGTRDDACGRCHEGAPAGGVAIAVPGATPCTTCHKEPQGPLSCSTCHGAGGIADTRSGAHAAHLEATPIARALPCSTCHPAPGPNVIGGLHADGQVEILFDASVVTPEASYDRATKTCAVSCHDRGGARPRVRWDEQGPLRCGDCHASPPSEHFPGACTTCHRDANANGTALTSTAHHVNGAVDLGDGSGGCGACHGHADGPWPSTNAHPTHASPRTTTPIACESCHPARGELRTPGHMNGVVDLAFGGRARDRGATPSWDGASCREVACHGARLVEAPPVIPTWSATPTGGCGSCHGAPPMQHTPSTSCDRSTCHGDEVARTGSTLTITQTGRALHVNGAIDVAP